MPGNETGAGGAALPTPLARVVESWRAESEDQPFRRIHRLIDAIEVFVKLHTVVAVSQFVQMLAEEGRNSDPRIADPVRAMLAAGLRTPSLGIWWAFARDSLRALDQHHEPFALSGGGRELRKGGGLFRAMEGRNNLIALRN